MSKKNHAKPGHKPPGVAGSMPMRSSAPGSYSASPAASGGQRAPSPPPSSRPVHTFESKAGRFGEPSREAIAETAYFIWLERGGSEVDNWLAAEARLRVEAGRGKAR